ncbi:MAG TPA: oxidase [Oceanospirillaceae bacterium]|nr:oxidase [Oceanospirillaceae bacterium]
MALLSRRKLLQSAATTLAAGATGLALPNTGFANQVSIAPKPLVIPPALYPRDEAGVKVYDLTMQNGETEIVDGYQTKTSGINGSFLGPTLRMRDGDQVRINVNNQLGEASTLHWHGMHLPASQDGGPHQVIKPGSTWSPQFQVRQKATSLWYHPHLMGKTGEHVWRGMAGMIYIEDQETDALELPQNYGADDVPLVLQDRWFTGDGQLQYALSMHSRMMGMSGNFPLANGTLAAFFEAKTQRLRLRLLNGSNASTYNLALSNGQPLQQIASDGGLLEQPVEVDLLTLSPGERAEVIVDLEAGKRVSLVNIGLSRGNMMSGENNNAPAFTFLEIRPAKQLQASAAVPTQLTTIERLRPEDAVQAREFDLEMRMGMGMMSMGSSNHSHSINGKVMDMKRIDETVQMGDTEIWLLRNVSMMPHPFHMHDVQFQILDRNGKAPPENERGRKDVVLVNPEEEVRIIMKFEHYRDDKYPFMYHCHILEHEDAGMMGQFLVV